MRAMLVVVPLELDKLPLEISRGPEQQAIRAFASYGPNQPFDDWMGARHVRHRLDLTDVKDPQVRLPLMEPVQRIMPLSARRRSRILLPMDIPKEPCYLLCNVQRKE